MRKFLFLLCAAFAISACSKDDDGNNNPTDKIVGEWRLTKMTVDGFNFPLFPCDDLCSITFRENGTSIESIYQDDFEGGCFFNASYRYPGTWEKKSGNLYDIVPNDYGLYKSFKYSVSTEVLFADEDPTMTIKIMESREEVNDGKPYLSEFFLERITDDN